jgi:hypothetical protein
MAPSHAPGGTSTPFVRHLRTGDFDTLAATLEGWDHRVQQLSGGPFRGELLLFQAAGPCPGVCPVARRGDQPGR